MISTETLHRAWKKTLKGTCRFRVAAIGLDRRGRVLGILTNLPPRGPENFNSGSGCHAEVRAISSLRGVHALVVVRFGDRGVLRPIHPCANCQSYADRRQVKLYYLAIAAGETCGQITTEWNAERLAWNAERSKKKTAAKIWPSR